MELLALAGWIIVFSGVAAFFYIFYKEGDGYKNRKDELTKIFSDSKTRYRNEKNMDMEMNGSDQEKADEDSDEFEDDYVLSILNFLEDWVGALVILKSLKKALLWGGGIVTIGGFLIDFAY